MQYYYGSMTVMGIYMKTFFQKIMRTRGAYIALNISHGTCLLKVLISLHYKCIHFIVTAYYMATSILSEQYFTKY